MATATTHVAIFAFPFSTHAAPLLHITRRLASFAPTTLFSFFSTAQSNSSIFSEENSEIDVSTNTNVRRCDVSDGVPEGYVFKGKPQEDIELFMRAAPETLRAAVATAEEETGRKVSCMVSDAFLWFVVEMAEERAVPWVACWTSQEHSLSTHFYTDLIRDRIGVQGAEAQKYDLVTFIPGMSDIRVLDLPDGIVFGNLESLFSKMLHKMGQVLPRAALVFANSFQELDPVVTNDLNSKLTRFIPIGPFDLLIQPQPPMQYSTHICLKWLDKQQPNSVVYISFGSVARPSQDEILALAEALEESKTKFLWSLRENLRAFLPNGFEEKNRSNGMVLSWVPQIEVLRHEGVGIFITHFGWNSLLESIMAEVPVIGRPFLGEQKLNGRLVEAVWKIGLQVERGIITKQGLLKSLQSIQCDNERKKMKDKIRRLKELAEDAVGHDGSSTKNFKCLLEIVSKT